MSEPQSVAQGASFDGAVTVADAGVRGMVTLRADLTDAAVAQAVKAATGLPMPALRRIETAGDRAVAWMSPDEAMVFCPYGDAPALADTLTDALGDTHSLVANVSDARAVFRLTREGVRQVLAKGTPADVSVAALPAGEMRRTRLGQVAVAFWLDDEETAHLVCFRSVGRFVWAWLQTASAPGSLPNYP
ncbi:MAG: sarcosine oxidase subunit gamma family protein [Pseudomonadota bacterium]